ncbi:TRAP transporter large permease [Nocardioides sp. NPDC051685]|uniref:TRAP transporter large permease n=1 Tax=Nocardioides sp. NPDC051685 TaxID=3364334 RepID=UPI0037A49CC3
MDLIVVGCIALAAMVALMALGAPVAISMTVPALVLLFVQGGWNLMSGVVYSILWNNALNYTLVTVPMFVLMGELLAVAGITADVYAAVRSWLWRLKGGLAFATVGACALFSAASGSSVATVGTLGGVVSKEMSEARYDSRLASGAMVAGGGLGILIPPSTAMLIYGLLTDQSIGKLFIAGLMPGIILTALFAMTIAILVMAFPRLAPPATRIPVASQWTLVVAVLLIGLVFVVVVGGLYLGWVGATEAAGLGAAIALVMGLSTRRLSVSTVWTAVQRSVRTTGLIFGIVIGGLLLTQVLAMTRMTNVLAELIVDMELPPIGLFAGIVLLYVMLGALVDEFAMIVLTVPIMLPIVTSAGWDPIWFGVVLVVLCQIGLILPPIGMNVFVLKGVAPYIPIKSMFTGALIFVVPMLLLLVLLYRFPQLALGLVS